MQQKKQDSLSFSNQIKSIINIYVVQSESKDVTLGLIESLVLVCWCASEISQSPNRNKLKAILDKLSAKTKQI